MLRSCVAAAMLMFCEKGGRFESHSFLLASTWRSDECPIILAKNTSLTLLSITNLSWLRVVIKADQNTRFAWHFPPLGACLRTLVVPKTVQLNYCSEPWPKCGGFYFPFVIYLFVVCFMWVAAFSWIFVVNNPYRGYSAVLSLGGVAMSHLLTYIM